MWTVCAQLDGSKSSLLQSTGSSPYVLVHIVGPPAATVLNIFFLWWKESIRCFDRHCWNAACCSRMSEVRDYRCSWLAVKWCSAFPLILWLYVWFLDLFFFWLSSFHIFKFFILYIFLRQTDIHNCSKFLFLLTHLEFSQHRMSVRKRWKAVKSIVVGSVKVTDQPWRISCSQYKNSYEQNFSSREFRGLFELEVCITQNKKKLHQRVLTECFEKHFKEKHGFIWLLKKETFWHSPTSFP